MKNTDFDAQIKSSLEQVEVPYEPATWDMLRQKMDQTIVEEHPAPVSEVDKAVFHKLQHLEMPYQPATWDMLASRMADTLRLRRRLWIGKIAEAAILLLLLVNIDGLLQMGSGNERTRPAQRPKSNRPQVEVPSQNARHRAYATVSGTASGDAQAGAQAYYDEILESIRTENVSIPLQHSFERAAENAVALYENEASEGRMTQAADARSAHAFAMFAALPGTSAPKAMFNGMFKTPVFPVKVAGASKLYAATFATFHHNVIKSEGDRRSANGYGGGIAVGYKKGKWAVEAGLAYGQASYNPKKEIEIYAGDLQNGYVGTYASDVDADIFSIPVKVTRKMAKMGRTSVHAVAGVTGNVSVQKAYRYKTIEYGTGPSTQPNPDQQSTPQFTQKGAGLLEKNGTLAGNFYATADVGLRIQRPVGKKLAAYVEPAYHQSLGNSGIGPKSNRINTVSFNAGVIASL